MIYILYITAMLGRDVKYIQNISLKSWEEQTTWEAKNEHDTIKTWQIVEVWNGLSGYQ